MPLTAEERQKDTQKKHLDSSLPKWKEKKEKQSKHKARNSFDTKFTSKGSFNENKTCARPEERRQINLENYILKKKARELHKIAPRPPQPTLHPPIVKKVLTLDYLVMLICCPIILCCLPVCLCAWLCFKRNKQVFGSHFSFSVSLVSIPCLFFSTAGALVVVTV